MLNRAHAVERLIDDGFEWYGLAAADTRLAGDHNLGLRVCDAVAERGVAESGIDDGVDRSNTGAGQHRNHALDGEWHVDDDAVSLANSK